MRPCVGKGETVMDGMMPRPIALRLVPERIPAELKTITAWVTWRYARTLDKNQKWTKEPYRVDSRMHAKTDDPSTWGTFSQAMERYRRGGVDGIGFMLSKSWGIAGIDLDHCVEPDGNIAVWALKMMHEIESYTEFSPSGTGIRILANAVLPAGRRKKDNIEVYDEFRYLTITGHHRAGHPETIEPRQSAVDAFHHRIFAETKSEARAPRFPRAPRNLEDNELLEKAFSARNNGQKIKALYGGDWSGYSSRSQADLALCDLLGFHARDNQQLDRLIRGSGLYREKWDERRGDETYGQRTIAKALSKWN